MGPNKALYGILAFGPIALILLSIVGIFSLVASDMGRRSVDPPVILFLFMGLILVGSLLSIVALIMYISRNPRLDDGARIGWIVGMIFAHGIVSIVYFFLHIVPDAPPPPQYGPLGLTASVPRQ